jgi:clorobiocin biosynthesis protein CloN6
VAHKPPPEIGYEFDTVSKLQDSDQYHLYATGFYNESQAGVEFFLDQVGQAGVKSVNYEQFHLTPDDVLERMAQANRRTVITLSPDSHDLKVAQAAGRGVYTSAEMERWIEKALGSGIYQVDIWYFIGLPEQNEKSVLETVDYCRHLLDRFRGQRVFPMVCPMFPLLDPGSTFFEHPDAHGYRVFYRTVEEHRRGMERASIINRINYETRWLSRSDLVYVGYKAVRGLMEAKVEQGLLPASIVKGYSARIDDALDFIRQVHEVDCIVDGRERKRELDKLGDEILCRNNAIFYSGVVNQAFPLSREIGGRWFDEMGWEPQDLAAAQGEGSSLSPIFGLQSRKVFE